MYEQLLLSNGGGISAPIKKRGQSENVVLIIGLGGTGTDCLRRVKRKAAEKIETGSDGSYRPERSRIRFLAVDCDSTALAGEGGIEPLTAAEYLDISDAGKAPLGTGGSRKAARELFTEKSDIFAEKVRNQILEVLRGLRSCRRVCVHIFSGLGGGTGSGILLDVCYIVRKVVKDIDVNLVLLTSGYVFLPDVNLSLPSLGAQLDTGVNIMANSFAAMKELDYCMGAETNEGCWEQQYKGFAVSHETKPPFSICYLISAHALSGAVLPDGYESALNSTADFALSLLMKDQEEMATYWSNSLSVQNSALRESGANYVYAIPGIAGAELPRREIMTCLASEMFEKFSDVVTGLPAGEEVGEYALDLELDFKSLLKNLLRGTSYKVRTPDLPEEMFRDMGEPDLGDPDLMILPDAITSPYFNMQNRMCAIMDMNIRSMAPGWDLRGIQTDRESFDKAGVWNTFFALKDIASRRGPLYASALLSRQGKKDLIGVLRLDLRTIEKNLAKSRKDKKLKTEEVKKARSAYLHPQLGLGRNRLFQGFEEAAADYLTTANKIIVLEKMQRLVCEMIGQFEKMHGEYWKKYTDVYNELIKTMHLNRERISEGSGFGNPDKPACADPMQINELVIRHLEETARQLDFKKEHERFHAAFFKAENVWCTGEEADVVRFMSDYVNDTFDMIAEMSLTEYLQIKFNTTDPDELSERICKEILIPLSEAAEPRFWKHSTDNVGITGLDHIIIPDSEPAMRMAADRFAKIDNLNLKVESTYKDGIFFLKSFRAVPLFFYGGSDVCRQIYVMCGGMSERTGRHIYEGGPDDEKDWRQLPDLLPYSMVPAPTKEQLEDERMIERALAEGIIKKAEFMNGIEYLLDGYEGIGELETAAAEAKVKGSPSYAKAIADQAAAYLAERKLARRRTIWHDTNPVYGDIICKDLIMKSPQMLEVIREQIRIIDSIGQIREDMSDIIRRDQMEQDYRYAVYTGVITVKRKRVEYVKEMYGMKKGILLSDRDMGRLGYTAPLYQGFLNFCGLEEKDRGRIWMDVAERLNNTGEYMEQIRSACSETGEALTDRHISEIVHETERILNDPETAEEIGKFYRRMEADIKDFVLIYGI